IPSLALFGFLIPVPFIGGIGMRTAIVALILYSLLPIVRNTLTGIRGVDPIVIDAGVAMGLTPHQLLRDVEMPLAMPTIVAGIRIATVVGIGVATIAAAIGGGGLGTLIFRGVSMVDTRLMLAGSLDAYAEYSGTVLIAILHQPLLKSRDEVTRAVADAYARRGLHWGPNLGFNDTFAMIVRKNSGLRTISDLKHTQLQPGFGYE